jgi:virginiamycin B lyase
VAAGEGAVWVANVKDNTVSRIDPVTNNVAATTRVGANPGALAVGGRAVWVANQTDSTRLAATHHRQA